MNVRKVLLLNADYSPIGIISIEKAVGMLMLGKIDDVGSDYFCIGVITGQFMLPTIMKLKEYKQAKSKKYGCSRKNVLIRDNYKCCYCGNTKEITIDHIIPQSKGGKNTWNNLVACCHKCNARKGDSLLEDVKMKLNKKPYKPTVSDIVRNSNSFRESWNGYLWG